MQSMTRNASEYNLIIFYVLKRAQHQLFAKHVILSLDMPVFVLVY